MIEKFCSGCRRWKPEHLIESKRAVALARGGKSITYYCGICAEKARIGGRKKAGAGA